MAVLSNTESLISQVVSLISNFTTRVRSLITIALVAIIVALIWVLATTQVRASRLLVIAPTAALLGLAILLLIVASFFQIRLRDEGNEVASGGEFVIGCLLGRQTVSAGMLRVRTNTEQLEHLARDVMRSYVGILVAGLSTLTHTLDPGIIVICGSLIERLQENDLFAKYLRESLPSHLVDSRTQPQLAPIVAKIADWQGAALLAWDLGYQRRHTYLSGRK